MKRRPRRWRVRHDRYGGAVYLHARGLHRLRGHLARAGDPAYPAHVGLEFRARHRAGRRDGRARRRAHPAREDHRLHRRAARRRQRRGRLRRDRAHARDVQVERRAQPAQEAALMLAGLSAGLAIQASYFVTAVLFIMGLKRMSSPVTARSGILWAGAGMLVATLITFLFPGMSNFPLIIAAMVVGGSLAWWSGKRVAMTNMPQMIALYNGMGGGGAAAIAAVELYRGEAQNYAISTLAGVGGVIGAVSFSGRAIAFGNLHGPITRS